MLRNPTVTSPEEDSTKTVVESLGEDSQKDLADFEAPPSEHQDVRSAQPWRALPTPSKQKFPAVGVSPDRGSPRSQSHPGSLPRARRRRPIPSDLQVHILSFEGPDAYCRAGGIASRVVGLSEALVEMGVETHLWYIGDPGLPGHERLRRLHFHRWCQWLSSYHRLGVYDGEETKRSDYSRSLPPFLVERVLLPHLSRTTGRALILSEEWHTTDAILHLDRLLRRLGARDRVELLWNANNTFGFHRIPWKALASAATLTTVSRYMRYRMWEYGVDPIVVSNGLSPQDLELPNVDSLASFRSALSNRVVLAKVGRWDPNKRWLLAVDIVAELKRRGRRPLLIARGGVEAHGDEVLARAKALGLCVAERMVRGSATDGLREAMTGLEEVDIVTLGKPLDRSRRGLLYRGADVVLANSGHEPFGLVGLESMAVGGLACTGGTGEDYAIPNWNALVVPSNDPREFIALFERLEARPRHLRAIRQHAQTTARGYCWSAIVQENLFARLEIVEPYDRVVPA